jgi:NADH:ubiquinone oxidoreductase subunit
MVWIKFLTWFKGELVGRDCFENRYYRAKGTYILKERRWVIYKGFPEASKVPAEWYGWLHHMMASPPTLEPMARWPWEKEHRPNLTGTPHAYYPSGHVCSGGQRNKATGDYEAWRPPEVKHENKSA